MDFSFSEEQNMLRSQAKQFLADRISPEKVVELTKWIDETDEPHREILDKVAWKEIAELGWVGLSAPEEVGGSGMSFLDEAVLIEELGYALYPGPYFSTVGLALPALAEDSEALQKVMSGEFSATVPAGVLTGAEPTLEARQEGSDWRLVGDIDLVPDLWEKTYIVTSAVTSDGPALFVIDADDEFEGTGRADTVDLTRRYSNPGAEDPQGIAAKLLTKPGEETTQLLDKIRLRALASAALEAVGVAQKALDLAKAYVSDRKQFDKPIGTYQAVSHQVADSYMGVELARSLAYWAAWCVAESDEQAPRAVAAAKSLATEVAVSVCERSIQVHGGIGFTWEHILHRYYKRAEWLDSFAGFGSAHRSDLAATLL
jgi:alkylation response protein AidB-like acyl-CoA dehydrogenase